MPSIYFAVDLVGKTHAEEKENKETFKKGLNIERNFNEALQLIKSSKPEVIVVSFQEDYNQTTLQFIKEVKFVSNNTKILALNPINSWDVMNQLFSLGVLGITDSESTSLHRAIQQLKEHKTFVSTPYIPLLLKGLKEEKEEAKQLEMKEDPKLVVDRDKAEQIFSARQVELMEDMITVGGTKEEIAERLNLSPRTVRNYIHIMFEILEVESSTQLITVAIKKGIICWKE